MLCAGTYYIFNSAVDDAKGSEMLGKLQMLFEDMFAAKQNKSLTNGELSEIKHNRIMYIADLYGQDPNKVYNIEMKCNNWREELIPHIVKLQSMVEAMDGNANAGLKIKKAFRSFPDMPLKNFNSNNARWAEAQYMMDIGFAVWLENGMNTPYSMKQQMYEALE